MYLSWLWFLTSFGSFTCWCHTWDKSHCSHVRVVIMEIMSYSRPPTSTVKMSLCLSMHQLHCGQTDCNWCTLSLQLHVVIFLCSCSSLLWEMLCGRTLLKPYEKHICKLCVTVTVRQFTHTHTHTHWGLMESISRRYHGLETSQAVQTTPPSGGSVRVCVSVCVCVSLHIHHC